MARPTTYNAEQVIQAIKGSGGIKATIARRLEVSRWTVDNYLNRWSTVQQAYDEEREELVDVAELELIKLIRGGHWQSIQFFLKTQGKGRGYIERQQIEHDGDVNIHVIEAND